MVQAFDPEVPAPAGIGPAGSDAEAARGAHVVLALTSAHEAAETLRLALPGIEPGAIYADLNTGSAGLKAELATGGRERGRCLCRCRAHGSGSRSRPAHADAGQRPAAGDFARIAAGLGAGVTVLPGPPGTAATRKLVRSVFYKGLAAAVTEALRAGRAAGCEDWLRDDIGQVLADASAATVDRLERGSIRHARRRMDEMMAAGNLLDELGVPARVTRASQGWLEQLMTEAAAGFSRDLAT